MRVTVRSFLVPAFVVLLFVVAAIVFSASYEEERSTAGLSFSPHVAANIEMRARLGLPSAPRNKRWYGVWLMLLGTGNEQPFLQVGLSRNVPGRSPEELAPFIAYRLKGTSGTMVRTISEIRLHGSAFHRFAIGLHQGRLYATMDGTVLDRRPMSDVLEQREAPTFQSSAELFSFGDHTEGEMADIDFVSNGRRLTRRLRPDYYLTDRGTCLTRTARGFVAIGVFVRGAPQRFYPRPPQLRATACR